MSDLQPHDPTDAPVATFTEPRPTAVTVVAWTWIVLGTFFASALFNLPLLLRADDSGIAPVWVLSLQLVAQFVGGVLGVIGGINLLKLRAWARTVLEVLTWALVVEIVGFVAFAALSFGLVIGAVMAGFAGVLYGIGLYFLLRALRSQRVKAAVGAPA